MPEKYLIVITGPTAVGKTKMALRLAKKLDTDIISCDSRQLFRELNIGVAKPKEEELDITKHHFINHLSIHDNYSAGQYERECIALLDELFLTKDFAILTGGTGLYIKAVLEGLDSFPPVSKEHKKYFEELHKTQGIVTLQKELKRLDPEYYDKVDKENPMRLIRALSLIQTTGKKFSSFRSGTVKKRNFKTIPFYLEMDKDMLYERINKRVNEMMKSGLLDEVKSLVKHKDLVSLQTVGYTELFDHIDGNITHERAIELIKRNTRRYAKRQMTWYGNKGKWNKIKFNDFNAMIDLIVAESSLVLS